MKKFCLIIIILFILFSFINISIAEINKEYDTAVQYYNTGKYREAINLLKIYVAKRPEPSAYYRIGYALYKLKKFNEANKYFEMTYLIDTEFSPQRTGLPELPEKMEKTLKRPRKEALLKEVPYAESKAEQPEAKPEPMPERQPSKEVQPPKTQMPAVTPEVKPPLPEPQKVEPPSPPTMFFPPPVKKMPVQPMGVSGLFAGFAMILILIEIALYIFFSLCLFLIAKKLNVPAPWTAWIPIVQMWTIVASACKPWWWLLLFLIPIVNIIVGIYLWICITENLGKNKWLGLLMLLPIVNFVFLGILAFSKSGGGYIAEAEV
ncbi:MAG: DUF5684 domain-containing protein [Thermodesulfovibrionales bacterium]